jgi:hypothetical protein
MPQAWGEKLKAVTFLSGERKVTKRKPGIVFG